ncbi:S53 family peptidase [Catenulispora rubra]|uniref:S53 family peptidase n=1 Tax=Catenulispora rubra TaxID=280293 RepID=UPI00189234EE|nr:protease pro-enzyme activation domain-containing protein [Catenulispora rubra]
MRRVRFRAVLVAACAAALAVSGAGAARAQQSRITLVDTSYQSGFGLTDAGPADPGTVVTDLVYLNVRDPSALAERVRSVSTPGSPDYDTFMTPAQIQARNQLSPAQFKRVRDWLASAGLSVTHPNWRELRITGAIGAMERAFDVTFDKYTDPNPGDAFIYQIPTTDLSIPGDLGSLVLDVPNYFFYTPTSNANVAPATDQAAKQSADPPAHLPVKPGGKSFPHVASTPSSLMSPCSRYWGQKPATGMPEVDGRTPSLAPCGYTPTQLRDAYGLDSETGKGQTVAVIGIALDTLEQDVNTWSRHVGTRTLRPGQLTLVPTPDGTPADTPAEADVGLVETTMDVEAVHGMAPDANVIAIGYTTSPDNGPNFDLASMMYVLDHTHATIVSDSGTFVPTPRTQTAYDNLYREGALQGVGFYYPSGDGNGSLAYQAGDQWTTGVGGTSLAIGPHGSREWETGWGDAQSTLSPDGTSWQAPQPGGGTGGGWMLGAPRPWYQQGVVSDREATGPDGGIDRTGPDVAMDADAGTGMLVGGTPLYGDAWPGSAESTWTYTERRYGGTSLSTPLFAGVQALAQQARGGTPLGFANPTLYRLSGTGAFKDITKLTGLPPAAVEQHWISAGTFVPLLLQMAAHEPIPGETTTNSVGPGFDTETGIGVPTGAYLTCMHQR